MSAPAPALRVDHPTDRPNFYTVDVGSLRVVFSYRTPIAFHAPGWGWTARKNVWGPTTGRHINAAVTPDTPRLDEEAFTRHLSAALADAARELAAALSADEVTR